MERKKKQLINDNSKMMNHGDHAALSCDDNALHHDIIDASSPTLSQPSSSPSLPKPLPSEYAPLTPTTHLSADAQTFFNLKMMKKHVDPSWLTLSQPSSSPPLPKPLPSEYTPSSPPRPRPFEYTPLTRPIDPQTFFYSKLITNLPHPPNFDSDPDNLALIPKSFHKDSHQEQVHVSLLPPSTTSRMLGRRECILPPSGPAKKQRLVKSLTVPPPFPWATSKRATVHTLDHLLSDLKLKTISGTLQCKFCKFQQDIQFDLVENFKKVTRFIEERRNEMCDRAPAEWMNPVIPNCERCGKERAMYPLMTKKRNINWLFLLLSQMIGCCKLHQLKYFCKHADINRSGGKDRLIYSTYFGLCKQLQPNTPFLS
jgi:DNA-directed RNA polymerase subunit M/transcription elongation factor TFIIS